MMKAVLFAFLLFYKSKLSSFFGDEYKTLDYKPCFYFFKWYLMDKMLEWGKNQELIPN